MYTCTCTKQGQSLNQFRLIEPHIKHEYGISVHAFSFSTHPVASVSIPVCCRSRILKSISDTGGCATLSYIGASFHIDIEDGMRETPNHRHRMMGIC